ncbi:MAG: 30S ribosomal protein S8 [Thermoanaerobaculia bacterium]|nr:30S ribosomal protein S8 [Thermoanaerobaculia bacterium]
MSMTDPIADMLSRIRNAIQSRHDRVDVPASNLKVEIARILKEQGFINNYKKIDEGLQGTIRISLKYANDGEPAIHGIERISRPGRRIYRTKTEIPRPLGGLGLSIVSTSRGVLSGDEAAKTGIGGEVLCQVW